MEQTIGNILHEDSTRFLFTLDTSKPAGIKYPTFAGGFDEDYEKFKKEMDEAFLQNRVSRSNRLPKLRECLRNHAKDLVPETTKAIDKAGESLHDAFGDPARVIKARKDKIVLMVNYPPPGRGSTLLKRQVEWLMNLELALRDITEIGENSIDMDREAFGGWNFPKSS